MRTLNGVDVAGLSAALLAWWENHGRGGIPWKLLPDGVRPAPDQELDAYPIWIADPSPTGRTVELGGASG